MSKKFNEEYKELREILKDDDGNEIESIDLSQVSMQSYCSFDGRHN